MSDMKKTVTCKYCSAEYPEELANCPYCGNANFTVRKNIYAENVADKKKTGIPCLYWQKNNFKEILKIAGITAAVIAVIIAVIFTIISIDKNNYSKQINEMRGNIINEIQWKKPQSINE